VSYNGADKGGFISEDEPGKPADDLAIGMDFGSVRPVAIYQQPKSLGLGKRRTTGRIGRADT